MRYGELGKRIGVAVITIPPIFAIILWGKIAFLLLVNVIIAMALWELYGLAERKGFFPSKVAGIFAILLISWNLYFYRGRFLGELLVIVVLIILFIELFKGKEGPLANAAITLFGLIYISLFSSFILIREIPSHSNLDYRVGGWLVILIFSAIWICDSGAYLLGARFGKHALFKRVSPNKTWEGAIAGFSIGIAASIGLRFLFVPSISIIDSMIIGIIIGVFGQISDLLESLFKRDAEVKDASNILPGHGGFLDRFDSPLFVGPVVYIYLKLVVF